LTDVDESLKTVAKGAGVIFIGMIIGKVLGAGNQILLARFLGVDVYGLFNLGLSVAEIAVALSLFGLGSGLTRFISYYGGKRSDEKVKSTILFGLKFNLTLCIILSIILFSFSEQIANNIFKDNRLETVLQIFALGLPFLVLAQFSTSAFRGFKAPKYMVYLVEIALRVTKIAFFLLFVFFGYLIYGAVAAYIIGSLIIAIFAFHIINKKLFPIFEHSIETVPIGKEFLSFSWPLTFSSISMLIASQNDILFLGFFKTSLDVGLYTAAYGIAILVNFASTSFVFLFLPVISELYAKNKLSELSQVYKSITKWIFLVTFPVFLMIIFFPHEILMTFYGSEYVVASTVLVLLSFAVFISTFVGPTSNILIAMDRTKLDLITFICSALTNIILNILLIPPLGIMGAAVGTGISIIVRNILSVFFVKRLLGVFPYDKQYPKIFLISILPILFFVLAIYFFIEEFLYWYILILFPLYFGLYFILLIKAKCLEENDKMVLRAIRKRMGIKLEFLDRLFR